MKYACFLKISKKLLDHPNVIKDLFVKPVKRSEKQYRRKGYNFTLTNGQVDDDFLRNLTTLRLEYDLFKTPRFISYATNKRNGTSASN